MIFAISVSVIGLISKQATLWPPALTIIVHF